MRKRFGEKLERGRIRSGNYASFTGMRYGAFMIFGPCGCDLKIVCSAGEDDGWEHVSVSTARRAPNWQEMSCVKELFWADEECVVQFHPPRSQYVNNHPHCLHLWKQIGVDIPLPPQILVGIKELGDLSGGQ